MFYQPNSPATSVSVTTTASFASPEKAKAAYISTDRTLRVSIDGSAPSATNGLYVPATSTSMLVCSANFANAIRVFNTEGTAANVTVQFV